MLASASFRTWLAIAFTITMLGLGYLNPHSALGGGGCGLSCGEASSMSGRF